jgi:uncharacterized protein YjbI with pentapeptide repeats
VNRADFSGSTLSAEQLYSTANYESRNLSGVNLGHINMSGWDFGGQSIQGATFGPQFTLDQLRSTASYQTKDLSGVRFVGMDLTGWDFSDQTVAAVSFEGSRITFQQLESTASYRAKNLAGVSFSNSGRPNPDALDLSFWDFRGQDLTGAVFTLVKLDGADFTDAVVRNASFWSGLTAAQLYSTKSYQGRDLRGITLPLDSRSREFLRWNLEGQDLSGAFLGSLGGPPGHGAFHLAGANLTNASLYVSGSDLSAVDLSRADLRGASSGSITDAPLTMNGATLHNTILPDGTVQSTDLNSGFLVPGLELAANETLVAYSGVPIPVRVTGTFSIAPTATFDLTDNAAIVDYTGDSPAETVRQQILTGRGAPGLGGKWNGPGITSSTAAAANAAKPDSRSVGYAENDAMPLGALTTFRGEPVDDNSILMAFTRTGDANLDGVVNDDDVTIVGATYAPGVAQPSWALGDFDYNGFVDDDDVTLLGAFYDPSAAPLALAAPTTANVVAVPEPATAALVLIGSIGTALLYGKRLGARRAVRTELPAFNPPARLALLWYQPMGASPRLCR